MISITLKLDFLTLKTGFSDFFEIDLKQAEKYAFPLKKWDFNVIKIVSF